MMAVIQVVLVATGAHALLAVSPRTRASVVVSAERSRRDVIADSALAVAAAAVGGSHPDAFVEEALAAETEAQEGRVVTANELLAFSRTPARRIVITGANSGIGLEGAKLLSSAGHEVICACRTESKAESAAAACGSGALPAVCDLADLSSVREFARSDLARSADTLVLNAGLAMNTADTEPRRTADGFELTIGTNHLGHFCLYRLLEDELKKKKGFRLVVTASPVHDPTSGGGKVGSAATLGDMAGLASGPSFDMVDGGEYDPDKAYKDSKLANLMFAAEASRRGVMVNSFSPGLIASPQGFFRYQNPFFARAFNAISKVAGVAETAEFGGSCLAFMATDASLEGVTAKWFDTEPPGKHQLLCHPPSDEARDVEKQKLLWKLSDKLVGTS